MARTMVIGTAGHIDHGKSALVRALTGTDPDRLKEEKQRGITIELGFAHATMGEVDVAFVDVPGHERFVRTMLAGSGGVGAVLLVVAANESVMPQTREHFEICRLLAIPRGIIVITKSDLADRDTIEIAALETRELVAGSVLARAPVVVVSATTGDGLDRLREAIVALAADGPRAERPGPARLAIDRAFSVHGFGTVVTGTLASGEVRVGDALELLPRRDAVRVRGVQVQGVATEAAVAPRRTAVNLGGVELERVARGMTLATAGSLAVTRRVDVRIELLPGARPLRHGARVRVHQGTCEFVARVSLSSVRSEVEASAWTRVDVGAVDVSVPPGGEALARLRMTHAAVLTRGDRMVLRAVSPATTIGGASVLDPEPPAGGIRRPRAGNRLEALTTSDPAVWAATVIAEAGIRGISTTDIARRGGLSPVDAERVVGELAARGAVLRAGESVLDAGAAAAAQSAIVKLLTSYHRAHPDEAGMPREVVRDHVRAGASLETLLAGLRDTVTGAERLALAAHRPAVRGEDARVMGIVDTTLKAAENHPPDVASLAASTGTSAAIVQKALLGLVKAGRVQRLDVLWFHADTLAALKAAVKALGPGATIDVAYAKAQFGVSRKFAIPLLEYLDRERITRRVADRRVVL
ncbi:MAG: selenocysteine-specific translation elongation factor [Vicinamibacterales bacterium]